MPDMPGLPHVVFFIGLNGLILLWLSAHVVMTRRRLRISIGDGGDPAMLRAMRAQANFIEMVPYCLLILLSMAVLGAPAWLIWVFGLTLTAGRILHGIHFTRADAHVLLRQLGTLATWGVLFLGAIGCMLHALTRIV